MKKFAIYAYGKCTRIRKALTIYTELVGQISFVIIDESEDIEIKKYFTSIGIDYYCFDYMTVDKKEDRNLLLSDYILELLNSYRIDYCLSFGAHILKGELLKQYNYKLINFHPGIIPEVIGLHVIDKAIKEGKRYIGNTVHFIDQGVDSGPIIMQNLILADCFSERGYDLYLDAQIELIWKTIKLLESDRIIIDNGKVQIKNGNYYVSHIFPGFEI